MILPHPVTVSKTNKITKKMNNLFMLSST
jgi:hypothetical protein